MKEADVGRDEISLSHWKLKVILLLRVRMLLVFGCVLFVSFYFFLGLCTIVVIYFMCKTSLGAVVHF